MENNTVIPMALKEIPDRDKRVCFTHAWQDRRRFHARRIWLYGHECKQDAQVLRLPESFSRREVR
jgi:hypothetical protein